MKLVVVVVVVLLLFAEKNIKLTVFNSFMPKGLSRCSPLAIIGRLFNTIIAASTKTRGSTENLETVMIHLKCQTILISLITTKTLEWDSTPVPRWGMSLRVLPRVKSTKVRPPPN